MARPPSLALDNYKALLTYHVFWTAVRNTIFYWLAHVFILMAGAFLLAVLVRSMLISHKNFYKPLIFMPNIVATVAIGLVFQSLFGTEYGVHEQPAGRQDPLAAELRHRPLGGGHHAGLARHRLVVCHLPGRPDHHQPRGRGGRHG